MAAPYEVLTLTRTRAEVVCKQCRTRQTADLNEDGSPAFEALSCQCGEPICQFCDQKSCENCGAVMHAECAHMDAEGGYHLCEKCRSAKESA